MYNLRPRLRITPRICFNNHPETGKLRYCFKVINYSLFPVYDLSLRAFVLSRFDSPNGTNYKKTEINIKYNNVTVLERFNMRHILQKWYAPEKKLTSQTDYAVIFVSYENLKEILGKAENELLIELISKHSVSGFNEVKRIKYFSSEYDLLEGDFFSGNSFKIKLKN